MSSRYKKVREKARKILQNLDQVEFSEESSLDSSHSIENSSSRSKLSNPKLWILSLVVFLFLLSQYLFFTLSEKESLFLSYGEAKIHTKKSLFFLTQGDSLPLKEKRNWQIQIPQRTSILEFSQTLKLQGAKDTLFQIKFLNSQLGYESFLHKGKIFVLSRAPLKIGVREFHFHTHQGSAIFESPSQNHCRVLILSGQWMLEKKKISAPSAIVWQGTRWKKLTQWNLPTWILPSPSFPLLKKQKKIHRPIKKEKNLVSTRNGAKKRSTPFQNQEIPPYPYHFPLWHRKISQLLQSKILWLDQRKAPLSKILFHLSNQISIPILLDTTLSGDIQNYTVRLTLKKGRLEQILAPVLKKYQWKLFIFPQEIRIAPIYFIPNLPGEQQIPYVLSQAKEILKRLEKQMVFVKKKLSLKTMDLVVDQEPFSSVIPKIQVIYGYKILYPSQLGKEKISLQLYGMPLDQILESLLKPLGYTYAPWGISGALKILPPQKAQKLWEKYGKKEFFFTQVYPKMNQMKESFLSQEIELPQKKWLSYQLIQRISQITALPIYSSQKLWKNQVPILTGGKIKVKVLLQKLKKNTPFQILYLDPEIYHSFWGLPSLLFSFPKGYYLVTQK